VTPGNLETLARQLESFSVRVSRGGLVVAQGGGELVLGSPLNALAHLIRLLATLPGHPAIEAGEIVTTGTLTDAMPVVAGETWSTRLEGLPLPGLVLRLV
jgi:2-oxo-3-hexenedioate decarboxylase